MLLLLEDYSIPPNKSIFTFSILIIYIETLLLVLKIDKNPPDSADKYVASIFSKIKLLSLSIFRTPPVVDADTL